MNKNQVPYCISMGSEASRQEPDLHFQSIAAAGRQIARRNLQPSARVDEQNPLFKGLDFWNYCKPNIKYKQNGNQMEWYIRIKVGIHQLNYLAESNVDFGTCINLWQSFMVSLIIVW